MNLSGLTLKPIWPRRPITIQDSRSFEKRFGIWRTSKNILHRYQFWKTTVLRLSKLLLIFTLLSPTMGLKLADQYYPESTLQAKPFPLYYSDTKCILSRISPSTNIPANETYQKQYMHKLKGGKCEAENGDKLYLINKLNENKVNEIFDQRFKACLKKIKYFNGFKKVNKVVGRWKCQLQNFRNKFKATKIDSNSLSESELRTDNVHSSYQESFPVRNSSLGTNLLPNPLKGNRFRNKKYQKSVKFLLGLQTEKKISKYKKQSVDLKSMTLQNSGETSEKNSIKISSNKNSLKVSNKKAKLKNPSTSKILPKGESHIIVKRSAPFLYDNLFVDSYKRKKRKIGIQEVEVIKGAMAALPCDLTMQQSQDSVQLVLWIKEGMDTPLYSYDYRELEGGRPKETKPNSKSTLAKRTSFRTDGNPAALLIERTQREDAGVYRCRVDFLLTPTRNSRVNLSVIVPPSRAKVSWKHSTSNLILSNAPAQTDSGVIGPFREGEIPTLICSNDDGTPLPNIKWYDGDQLVDETYSVGQEKNNVTNTLELPPLTRSDLGKRYTCQASNYNKTQPATSTITIGMILKIMSVKVEITGTLQANVQSDIQCQVRGSIPVPNVSWWLGSKKLQVEIPQVQEEGNLTVSTLHFTPTPEDDGALLICQAINTKIVDDVIQDTKLISVNYIPRVSVRLGRSLNPSRIKEGDDVYFECSVIGKPPVFNIQWKHNDVALEAGSGIFVSNMSLVVQRVSRDNGGDYTCHATNPVGTGVSPPLQLDVKYAPVCAIKQRVQHSVAKLENAEILCKVHANPANVTFRWTFNNTAEAIDVPDGRFVISGTESRVNYTPMNELDYGTLLCWANNSIGVQDHPCVFQIVAAGKPDPPHNCRVYDVTISSLQVTCLAGDDGGLTQKFMMQVFKIGSSSPEKDMTKLEPSFSVANLRPATAYKILVVSLNEKGASRPTELKAYTVRMPETQEETSAEPTRDRERDSSVIPFGVIVGSSVAAVPIVLITVFVIWCRTCRKSPFSHRRQNEFVSVEEVDERISYSRGRQGGGPNSESAQSISRKDSSLARSSLELPLSTDSSNAEDCNPDIISHTSDPLDNQKLIGNISTISNEPTGYFIGNGDTNFIPLKCGAPISTHCMEYLQIMVNNNRSQVQENLQSCSLIHSSTDLPLNPNDIQIQYSTTNSVSKLKAKPQRSSSHTSEQGLPLPNFYAQSYNVAKGKSCSEKDKSPAAETIQEIFAQSLPHLYQQPCGPYTPVTYKQDQTQIKKTTSCMRAYQDEKQRAERLHCSNHISNVQNVQLIPGSHYQRKECSQTMNDRIPVSSQSILHYGTLHRANNGNSTHTSTTDKQRTIYNATNRGSMPDVRDPAVRNNVQSSSHRKPKRESDV